MSKLSNIGLENSKNTPLMSFGGIVDIGIIFSSITVI